MGRALAKARAGPPPCFICMGGLAHGAVAKSMGGLAHGAVSTHMGIFTGGLAHGAVAGAMVTWSGMVTCSEMRWNMALESGSWAMFHGLPIGLVGKHVPCFAYRLGLKGGSGAAAPLAGAPRAGR